MYVSHQMSRISHAMSVLMVHVKPNPCHLSVSMIICIFHSLFPLVYFCIVLVSWWVCSPKASSNVYLVNVFVVIL